MILKNPNLSGYCCELDTGACYPNPFVGPECPKTSTTTSTTTSADILPDFGCSHHNPCPSGYCCELDTGACYSNPFVGQECPKTTPRTADKMTSIKT